MAGKVNAESVKGKIRAADEVWNNEVKVALEKRNAILAPFKKALTEAKREADADYAAARADASAKYYAEVAAIRRGESAALGRR